MCRASVLAAFIMKGIKTQAREAQAAGLRLLCAEAQRVERLLRGVYVVGGGAGRKFEGGR